MFFEVARIAKEKQPKVLLLENVKGLVGHDKGKTLDTIVRVLNEIGYRVDFQILNRKYFGVPQNRERIFIVGVREDLIPNEPWRIEGNTVVPKGKRRISGYEGEQAWNLKTFNFDYPEQTEVTTRLKDILEDVVDEKFYISDEKTAKLVAQLEEQSDGMIIDPSHAKREGKPREYTDVSPTITARDYKEPRMVGHIDIKGHDYIKRVYSTDALSPTVPTGAGGNHEPKIAEVQSQKVVDYSRKTGIGNVRDISLSLSASDWRGLNRNQKQNAVLEQKVESIGNVNPSGKGMNGQVYSANAGLSPTITTNKGEGAKILQEEQFTAKKPNERLSQQAIETANNSNLEKEHGDFIQAYNHDHNKEGISPTLTTRPEGLKTAILPIVEVRATLTPEREEKRQNGRRFKEDGEPSFTVNTQDRHGVTIGSKPKYRIRKLTPKECFRLQGFSDEDFDKLAEAGISNSQLYKMAGNAVTVNVIEAIGERLVRFL